MALETDVARHGIVETKNNCDERYNNVIWKRQKKAHETEDMKANREYKYKAHNNNEINIIWKLQEFFFRAAQGIDRWSLLSKAALQRCNPVESKSKRR